MKPDSPVRCTFKKTTHTCAVCEVRMCPEPCFQRHHTLQDFYFGDNHYNGPRWLKEGGGGLFKGEEGDHCEIKHVRDRWCVFKWNMWNKTWRGFSWWRPTKTVSLVKIVIFLPLHSQPCSLFKYWIAIFLLERHFWPDFFWILTCERPVVAKSWI